MHIAGENGNVPSWVADWPHYCEFIGHSCDGLRCAAILLEPSKSQENSPLHRIVWQGLIVISPFNVPLRFITHAEAAGDHARRTISGLILGKRCFLIVVNIVVFFYLGLCDVYMEIEGAVPNYDRESCIELNAPSKVIPPVALLVDFIHTKMCRRKSAHIHAKSPICVNYNKKNI